MEIQVVIKKVAVIVFLIGLMLIIYTAGVADAAQEMETKMMITGIVMLIPFPVIQGMWG